MVCSARNFVSAYGTKESRLRGTFIWNLWWKSIEVPLFGELPLPTHVHAVFFVVCFLDTLTSYRMKLKLTTTYSSFGVHWEHLTRRPCVALRNHWSGRRDSSLIAISLNTDIVTIISQHLANGDTERGHGPWCPTEKSPNPFDSHSQDIVNVLPPPIVHLA